MKKEFARFFGDRRMLVMILLPGILIYVIYSFLGSALVNLYSPDENYTPTVYAADMPDSIGRLVQSSGSIIVNIGLDEVEGVRERISLKEADICVVFPPNFDNLVNAYNVQTSAGPAPNIEVYFNSTQPNSQNTYSQILMLLDEYESSLANKFDVNRGIGEADQATSEDISASIVSSMLPMFLMLFMYVGCIGIAPESIAGEKERGTIATLLVTPMKRGELAVGKILSLAVLSFISGMVTAVATILSLPKLMGGSSDMLNVGIYSAVDYLLLAFIILSTILLLVAVVSIISAFAKTVKEASTAVVPLMIIVMLVGISGMFGGGGQPATVYFLIPLYSSAQSMNGIFSLDYSALSVLLSCLSSLVYAVIGGFVLTKMFNSEKIMFSR
ncbi:MAG: ABC transporter permease subunit [Oscillospiraceae bacterium]|jgi:sodium transport system permease protein|nr:ABC transporter permease subunit [Oscillospiraceae bacterium]